MALSLSLSIGMNFMVSIDLAIRLCLLDKKKESWFATIRHHLKNNFTSS
jgi:hypothetical protein